MSSSETVMAAGKPVSALGGAAIVAGAAVGAGMFSLPTLSSGMWFGWSLACMLLCLFCMYCASLMILEVNLHFRPGESFDTLVAKTLGKGWNVVNGVSLAFLLYILDYAYISGGGSALSHTLQQSLGVEVPQILSGLLFALLFAFVVWLSTSAVKKVVAILVVGMLVSFLMVFAGLSATIDTAKLLGGDNQASHIVFLLAAIPFYLAAFGFHAMVPSLVKYYGNNPSPIRRSVLTGSLICFAIYLLWLLATMGNIPRASFLAVAAEGGNVAALMRGIGQAADSKDIETLLSLFANMAVISSFLGVSLALFDFIADKFGFPNTPSGRLKTALVAFVPPVVGGLFFPDGFLYGIGFAGLSLSITALIVPGMMLQKSRKIFPVGSYRLRGGNGLVYFIIAMGVLCALCKILVIPGLLPVYGR